MRDPRGGALGPRDPSLISPAYVRVSSVAPNPTSLRSGIETLRYRVDGNPKRYNDPIEAYVPTQYAGIVRDPKGGGRWDPGTHL